MNHEEFQYFTTMRKRTMGKSFTLKMMQNFSTHDDRHYLITEEIN